MSAAVDRAAIATRLRRVSAALAAAGERSDTSPASLQRMCAISYTAACRLRDQLVDDGVLEPPKMCGRSEVIREP